jgi:pSer/pThr/pTyr-binding forkhead associated (FHA) protein
VNISLVLFKKNGSQKIFSLPSDVPLTSVSRKHCQLNRQEGVLKVRDLGSRNGTYLNGKRVDEAEIRAGDSIKVGPLTFVLQIDGQPKNINIPGPATGKPLEKEASTGDSRSEDSDIFAELGELDALEELDDFDPLAESDSS